MALHGCSSSRCTFLVLSDDMRPQCAWEAMSPSPTPRIFTHDSIWYGDTDLPISRVEQLVGWPASLALQSFGPAKRKRRPWPCCVLPSAGDKVPLH